MADVRLVLKADNTDYVNKVKEAQKETQKLHDTATQGAKREKGILEEIDATLTKLEKARRKAFSYEDIEKYNKKIAETKQYLKEYEEAGLKTVKTTESMTQSFVKWITTIGLATTVLNALKKAFFETQQGILLFNTAGAAMNQILYNIVNGVQNWNTGVAESIVLAKKMNDLRLKDRFEMLEAKKLMQEYNELYTEGIDANISHEDKIKKLTAAKAKYQAAIDVEINSTREQLRLAKQAFDLAPANDKKQLAVIELMGKLTDLRAQRVGGIRRLERQITGEQERQNELQIEALQRIKDLGVKLGKAFEEDFKVQAEKDKKIADDRAEYIRKQSVAAEIENQKFIEDYLKQDQINKDNQFKNEVDLQRKVAKSQKDAAKDKWDQMLEDERKQKEFDDYKLEQRKQSIEALGALTIDYINIISSLSEKEVEKAQVNRELLDTRIIEANDALQVEIELYKAGYASNVAAKQKEIEDLKALRDKALKDEEEARKKAHKLYVASVVAQKAVDIASIISQTGVANAKAVAVSPLTFGQPWVALNTIRAALSIAAAVAAVAAAQSAKFAKGGWTGDGRQRDETGERVAGIVHEREFVVRKGPAYKFREVLEAINKDDRKMIFNSFNKIDPNLLKGEVVNNVIVQNEGPNKRLDQVTEQLKQLNRKSGKESVFEIQGARIIHKGNNTKIIKR